MGPCIEIHAPKPYDFEAEAALRDALQQITSDLKSSRKGTYWEVFIENRLFEIHVQEFHSSESQAVPGSKETKLKTTFTLCSASKDAQAQAHLRQIEKAITHSQKEKNA